VFEPDFCQHHLHCILTIFFIWPKQQNLQKKKKYHHLPFVWQWTGTGRCSSCSGLRDFCCFSGFVGLLVDVQFLFKFLFLLLLNLNFYYFVYIASRSACSCVFVSCKLGSRAVNWKSVPSVAHRPCPSASSTVHGAGAAATVPHRNPHPGRNNDLLSANMFFWACQIVARLFRFLVVVYFCFYLTYLCLFCSPCFHFC